MSVNSLDQLWESVLVEIELSVSPANFSTWFKDTDILRDEDGMIFLSVPNEFVKQWLAEKYHKNILKSLRSHAPNVRGIEYVVSQSKEETKKRDRDIILHRTPPQVLPNELPLSDHYVSKEDNLNPRYVFETFIIGPFNELAFAAAQAIIKKPGIMYNPLFVYGNTGHGKTHLIQAIGNALKSGNSTRQIYYVSSEKFLMDYVSALQNNRMNIFKEKYRKYDVFIMDDIQFLSKKDKTQEELFHLFNHLYDNNKQIVFSSDKHPGYLQEIETRLQSRFAAGMIVEIATPDHEARVAILKAKSKSLNFMVSQNTLDYLASMIESNIRELEGSLNAIMCQSQLRGRELSIPEIKNLIRDNTQPIKATSVKDVIRIITSYYDVDESAVHEKTRRKEIVKPRQVIMYILREDLHVSYPTIGQKLGGRDHTTVIHSCEKIKREVKVDPLLMREIEQIRAMLK